MGCQTHWHDLWRAIDKSWSVSPMRQLVIGSPKACYSNWVQMLENQCLKNRGWLNFKMICAIKAWMETRSDFSFWETHWSFIFHSWVPSTILFYTCVCCVLATGTGQCRHSTHFTPEKVLRSAIAVVFFYTKAPNVSEGAQQHFLRYEPGQSIEDAPWEKKQVPPVLCNSWYPDKMGPAQHWLNRPLIMATPRL